MKAHHTQTSEKEKREKKSTTRDKGNNSFRGVLIRHRVDFPPETVEAKSSRMVLLKAL